MPKGKKKAESVKETMMKASEKEDPKMPMHNKMHGKKSKVATPTH